MEKMNVAVIGAGHAGRDYHLPGLCRFPDIEVSLCDIKERVLHATGELVGIPPERRHTDYRRMIKAIDPAAVFVLMAQYPHGAYSPEPYFNIVHEMLDQQRAVFVEKPLAMTLAAAQPLADKARARGCITMVGMNRRFNPLVTFCMEAIHSEGPVRQALCQFFKHCQPLARGRLNPLTAELIHAVDLLRFLAGGEVAACHACASRSPGDAIDSAYTALVRFKNGTDGIFSANLRAAERIEHWQLHGAGLSAIIERAPAAGLESKSMQATLYRPGEKPAVYQDDEIPTARPYLDRGDMTVTNGFAYADHYFITCVQQNKQPHCHFGDACETLALCEQIGAAAAAASTGSV